MGKDFASLKLSLGDDFNLSEGLSSGSLNVTSSKFYGPDEESTGAVNSLDGLNKLSSSVTKYTVIDIKDTASGSEGGSEGGRIVQDSNYTKLSSEIKLTSGAQGGGAGYVRFNFNNIPELAGAKGVYLRAVLNEAELLWFNPYSHTEVLIARAPNNSGPVNRFFTLWIDRPILHSTSVPNIPAETGEQLRGINFWGQGANTESSTGRGVLGAGEAVLRVSQAPGDDKGYEMESLHIIGRWD